MNQASLSERMLAIDTGLNSTSIKLGLLDQQQLDLVSDSVKRIKSYPIHIDSNYRMDMNYILATTRRYQRLHGVRVVYLDYIQLLAERTADATNELGRFSRGFKLMSNELGICSVLLSQLNRLVETREDKHPQLSDLRQSGNLEEDADIVVGIYRDIKYNKNTKDKNLMELIVLKQRNGPCGMVPTNFEEETNKVTDKVV
jgi:replicative DNA helicase